MMRRKERGESRMEDGFYSCPSSRQSEDGLRHPTHCDLSMHVPNVLVLLDAIDVVCVFSHSVTSGQERGTPSLWSS